MASSLSTTASTLPKATTNPPLTSRSPSSPAPFRLCSYKPKLGFPAKGLRHNWNRSIFVKTQSKEVAFDGSSNAAAISALKSGVAPSDSKDTQPSGATLATEESISEFISQVSNLVKLVDSKDIVELQLKQLDCELLIRKKEALPQPPSLPPPMMIHSPASALASAAPPMPAPAPVSAPPSAPSPSPSPPAAKSAESSLPPLKCPMAGTFYRSPGPSEQPFVKKGDKVQKGQVVCIIEAMKLMNEIEADQSGTIVDVLVEDGKPVSVDTPLFIIKP
ncbi:biotin carboxyl carrier protein of acetyl-CoA carboxylase, chloroplastic isoform X2 [Punica granatum]|uniref:Biotin carboxyl carrier protein of acetyl-CoA carboxylase n=1 Tax=Punica granatum TaxID=22663 RepID=A0A6P8DWM3_PUNGR|nr:biotin carboxyl carrier protein of acetyl-CoA carboxylase, chloroplastic isoform X2 [Punica granatum]